MATSDSSFGEIQWLNSDSIEFSIDAMQRILLKDSDHEVHEGVFCLRAFPARFPDRYISVRCWDEKGDAVEVGMISNLAELDPRNRGIVSTALERHYLLRKISAFIR